MRIADCQHVPKVFADPRSDACEEKHVCEHGMRVCLTCGYVGCCDTCLQHMRKHAKETGHEVMASYPADSNSFIWCYKDDDYLEPDSVHHLG